MKEKSNLLSISICPYLYIKETEEKGRGVFTEIDLPDNSIIEISPVLVMDKNARKELDKTELYNYIFEWGEEKDKCCIAWGYVSMYNHSYEANCEYFMDFQNNIIEIRTVRQVKKGEELTINYSGESGEQNPVWFPIK